MSVTMKQRCEERGLKLVESTKPLILSVNSKDVARATEKQADECALARACKRQYHGIKAAYFFRSTAYLEYEDRIVRYLLPQSVQKEIVSFDRSKKFEPGNYHLRPVSKGSTFAALRSRTSNRSGSSLHPKDPRKTGRRTNVHRTTDVRPTFNVLT